MTDFDHVLLVGFGGPEKRADIWPFLLEVTRGTNVPEERLKDVLHHYEQVGGKSPYNEAVRQLARNLQEVLSHSLPLPVFTGMKNWHPFMKDTLTEIKSKGLRKGIAVVLAPHRSPASWDKYLRCVEETLKETGAGIVYEYVRHWYDHPGFTGAFADQIKKAMGPKYSTHVIFCAHSIPVEMAAKCEYAQEFKISSELAAREAGVFSWNVAYQSRSGSPRQPWLEPDICDSISETDKARFTDVLAVPIGFLCENVEILFDLDIEARQAAEKSGLKYRRCGTVMESPRFISMMTDLILEKAGVLNG